MKMFTRTKRPLLDFVLLVGFVAGSKKREYKFTSSTPSSFSRFCHLSQFASNITVWCTVRGLSERSLLRGGSTRGCLWLIKESSGQTAAGRAKHIIQWTPVALLQSPAAWSNVVAFPFFFPVRSLSSRRATQHFSPWFCCHALPFFFLIFPLPFSSISMAILFSHHACARGQKMLRRTETEERPGDDLLPSPLWAPSSSPFFSLRRAIIQFKPLSTLFSIKTFLERIFQSTLLILMDVTAPPHLPYLQFYHLRCHKLPS